MHSTPARFLLFALLTLAGLATRADAHFLWLSIRSAETRELHGHFSEGRFDDTVPFLNATLEKAELSMAGKPLAWQIHTSGATCRLGDGADLVSGSMLYGLFGRGGGQQLLYYDAKAAWDLEAAGRRVGLAVEILAHRVEDDLTLTVLREGKPVAGSEVIVVQDGTIYGQELETGEDGTVRMVFPASPAFAVRARVREAGTGEHNGKPYDGVLRYSTLCIERLCEFRSPAGSDVEAALMLNEARLRTSRMPAGVKGIRGEVFAVIEGKRTAIDFVHLSGSLEVFEADDLAPGHAAWARRTLQESLMGTAPLAWFAQGPIEFTGAKPGPLGTSLRVGAGGTTVRLKEHEVREIRSTSNGERRVRTILESMETEDGHLLPIVEMHSVFGEEGDFVSYASVQRAYTQVGAAQVPESVKETSVGAEASGVRALDFGPLELIR